MESNDVAYYEWKTGQLFFKIVIGYIILLFTAPRKITF